jgi:hypothetical protein
MLVPTTYYEWTDNMQRFASGDDSVISEMESAQFEIDAGTVYRFYSHVQASYVERKNLWIEKFNRLFQIQKVKSENELGVLMQSIKNSFNPIVKFINLPAFPDDLKTTLKADFNQFINELKNNMNESLKKEQPHNEKLLFVIHSFQFHEYYNNAASCDNVTEEENETIPRNKMRILFDGTQR